MASRGVWLVGTLVATGAALTAACSGGESGHEPVSARASPVSVTLNTFVNKSIEIDALAASPPGDANLFVGPDPADGSASAALPTGGPATFIDWEDLGGDLVNHRLLDLNDAKGKDPTSFPRSNECVGASSVLSKMDLTYIASANNSKYGYFAVQRSNNNGDAGYYWIFTRKEPHLNAGQAPCHSDENRLLYDISGPDPSTGAGGDVLLAGHFHPNGTPLLTVYRATSSHAGVTAIDAIDFTNPMWAIDPAGVAAVAVNTSVTASGAFGAAGVIAASGGDVEEEIFAEAAVPMSVFTGGSTCGATFYGSVITRSSGSGGTSPDLKDLAGPALFNFGKVTAKASLSPTCGLGFGYTASGTGADGNPLAAPKCSWVFDNGATSTSCTGSADAAVGAHTGTVTVSDPNSDCSDKITTAAVDVYAPLGVSAKLLASCALSFGYDATVTGGSNPGGAGIAWTFSGGGTVTPSSSSSKSGSVAVGTGGVSYTGNVVATDTRSGITCTASASDSATPLAPLAISLKLKAPAPTCPEMSSDAVTYSALPVGGNGAYSYGWNGVSCVGTSCTVDPSDSAFCAGTTLSVTVTDSSGLCPPATSETETYAKVTTVTATDN